jgi:hypothetical protein
VVFALREKELHKSTVFAGCVQFLAGLDFNPDALLSFGVEQQNVVARFAKVVKHYPQGIQREEKQPQKHLLLADFTD